MGIFIFIGSATIGVLRSGLFTWRTGESRRKALETAQLVLSRVEEDLRNMYTREFLEGQPADIQLLCDRDSNGRQRIRFVRTVGGAVSAHVHKEAGSCLGADSDLDLVNDYREARMGALRATGGLCEVAYVMDSDPASNKLFRGIRAPAGGEHTFFLDSNLLPATANSRLIEFADCVLYLGFLFWTQYTDTWDARYWPMAEPGQRDRSGPAFWWDSTRSRVPPFQLEKGEFTTHLSGSSLLDPRDDIFPRAVQVTLVVAEERTAAATVLADDITENATRIPVADSGPFASCEYKYVKIDAEWIRFSEVGRGALTLEDERARGARWTIPAPHRRGAAVQAGRTFAVTLHLPGVREDWNSK
jgi:hypothetical protein